MSDQSVVHRGKNKDSFSFGIILIVLGGFFLFDRLDVINARDYFKYWPALIALSGVICVLRAKGIADILDGFMQIGVAAWLFAITQNLYGLTFRNSWPLFLIAIGLSMAATAIVARRTGEKNPEAAAHAGAAGPQNILTNIPTV